MLLKQRNGARDYANMEVGSPDAIRLALDNDTP